MEEKLLSAISTVGFPIVVSCYLLVKFQATLDRFSNKVDELILELRNGYYYMPPIVPTMPHKQVAKPIIKQIYN